LVLSHLAYGLGVLLVAAGVDYQFGIGWALVITGVGLIGWALLLFEVDEPEQPELLSGLRQRGESG
jgi:hypothetical protein